mgnify:FL=1
MGTKHYLCINYFCEIMEKIFKAFNYLSFILVLIFFSTCKNKENPELKKYSLNGRTQGTYYHIVYYAPTDKWCIKNNWQTSSQIKKSIDSILIKIDNSISLWNPQSLLNKINDNQTNVMNTILKENFLAAEKISKLTDGNFDISLGALIEAHGFAAKERKKLSKQEIDSMMLYVGYEKLRLEDDKLIKQYPQTKIDFNAIAQGYTTDQISNYLKRNNINQHIVDVGGEVFASGKKPDGQQWRVAIEEPSKDMYAEREYNSFIKLENKSIVTSGNYRKYIEEDGIRLSHTINPKTGYSVSHNLLSVSVIAQDATTADGLATAFMVMGKEKAEEFLNTHPEYDAIFIYSTKEGEIETSHTKNLDQILEKAE